MPKWLIIALLPLTLPCLLVLFVGFVLLNGLLVTWETLWPRRLA